MRDKKASVLFNPVENNANQGVFVKRAFRDFNKTEKNREHAQTQFHNEAILRAQEFVKTYEHPTTHVDHDVHRQKWFDGNAHTLKLIIKTVSLCSKHCHCVVTATTQVIYFQRMVISSQSLKL